MVITFVEIAYLMPQLNEGCCFSFPYVSLIPPPTVLPSPAHPSRSINILVGVTQYCTKFTIIPEQNILALRSGMVTNPYVGYLHQDKNNGLTIDQCLPHPLIR